MTQAADNGRPKAGPKRADPSRDEAAAEPTAQPSPSPKSRGPRRDGRGASPERRAAGGRRHLGRILALQVLYEADVTDHQPAEILERTFLEQDLSGEDELPLTEDSAAVRAHVERLVGGVLGLQDVIDPHIAGAAPAFPVAQLPSIDRNVLRLAIYELLRETDVPVKAAINEAVELAKRFGGDNSGRFVNGVLGTVAQRIDAEARRQASGVRRQEKRGGATGAKSLSDDAES